MEFCLVNHRFIDQNSLSFMSIKLQKSGHVPRRISGKIRTISKLIFLIFYADVQVLCILSMIQRANVQHQIIIYKDVHHPTILPPNVKLSCTDAAGTLDRGIVVIVVYETVNGSLEHQILGHQHRIIKYKKNKMEHGLDCIYK